MDYVNVCHVILHVDVKQIMNFTNQKQCTDLDNIETEDSMDTSSGQ